MANHEKVMTACDNLVAQWLKTANDETINPRVRLSLIADSMKRYLEMKK